MRIIMGFVFQRIERDQIIIMHLTVHTRWTAIRNSRLVKSCLWRVCRHLIPIGANPIEGFAVSEASTFGTLTLFIIVLLHTCFRHVLLLLHGKV